MEKGCENFFYHRSRNIAMGAVVLREETDNVGGSVGGMQDPGSMRPRGELPKGQSVPSLRFPLLLSLPPLPPFLLHSSCLSPSLCSCPGAASRLHARLHAHGRSGDNTEAE